jgi:putative DNA primase/helicase
MTTNNELDKKVIAFDRKQAEQTAHVLPPPKDPMEVARIYITKNHQYDGLLTLRHWHGGWWHWRKTHWAEIADRLVRAWLYNFTVDAMYMTDDLKVRQWSPNRHKITDVIDALAAACILDGDIDQPCWLNNRATGTIVSCASGLLDVDRQKLLPQTPDFFNQTAVPFDYDPKAPSPTRWLNFLEELWPSEPDAINVLGEWFGYVISGRTDLHKILLMVGPTRGGKGAISRVLSALIGRHNVAGPTLNSLGGEFGLAPLIGKPLAIISDARFSGRNNNIVIERLLSISGEDALTVNRKYRDQWTGKLPSRLHVISNELPKLSDASAAIIGRMVLLILSRSWLGKEDHTLENALRAELPAILNWALDGLRRLTIENDNNFTIIASSDEAIIALRDLASPVGAFVREIGPQHQIEIDVLYKEFKTWAEDNGHPKQSKQAFGKDLHAGIPSVRVTRPRDGRERTRIYIGIGLRA